VYELDPYGVRLTGAHGGATYGLGDRVRLTIQDVSIAQRKVLCVPEGLEQNAQASGAAKPGNKRSTAVQAAGGSRGQARRERNKSKDVERSIGRKKRKERMQVGGSATTGVGKRKRK
jgi:hypothetical protein